MAPGAVHREVVRDAEALARIIATATARELTWAAIYPERAEVWSRLRILLAPVVAEIRQRMSVDGS